MNGQPAQAPDYRVIRTAALRLGIAHSAFMLAMGILGWLTANERIVTSSVIIAAGALFVFGTIALVLEVRIRRMNWL